MTDANGPSRDGTLSESECHELLASESRQALLEWLATASDRSHTLESLASAVSSSDDMDQVQAVSLSLHHVHLPKLDDADVLDYDPNSKTVECRASNWTERLLEQF